MLYCWVPLGIKEEPVEPFRSHSHSHSHPHQTLEIVMCTYQHIGFFPYFLVQIQVRAQTGPSPECKGFYTIKNIQRSGPVRITSTRLFSLPKIYSTQDLCALPAQGYFHHVFRSAYTSPSPLLRGSFRLHHALVMGPMPKQVVGLLPVRRALEWL